MRKILIIEDEQNLARFIELELTYADYEVEIANDGAEGLKLALLHDYDCILLDLMLPKMNGLDVCRKVRSAKETPIIMIAAKGDTHDKVAGLDRGADDYIVKPFDIEELLARLRVIMRRNEVMDTLRIGELTIDEDAFKVFVGSTNLELTKTEFELLKLLAENRNHVLTREQILTHVWGYNSEVETNVVDVYIRYLRNKLKPFNLQTMIETVRGVGYVIR